MNVLNGIYLPFGPSASTANPPESESSSFPFPKIMTDTEIPM